MLSKSDKTYYDITGVNLIDNSQVSQLQILNNLSTNEKLLNIGRSFTLDVDEKASYLYFDIYTVKESTFGDLISYECYNTTDYGGIIAIFNDIKNPFETLYNGQVLYILKLEYIPKLLKQIKNIKSI